MVDHNEKVYNKVAMEKDREDFIDKVALRILPVLLTQFDKSTIRPHASETAYCIAGDLWEAKQKFFRKSTEQDKFVANLKEAYSRDPSLRGES